MQEPRNKPAARLLRLALIPIGIVVGAIVILLGVLALLIGLVIAVPIVLALVARYWLRRLAGRPVPVGRGEVVEGRVVDDAPDDGRNALPPE
jgi:membrane protein implicated in regulation of membrane protease activity